MEDMDDDQWIALMDELKTTKEWSSDVQLAGFLGVTRAMISIVRSKRQEMPAQMKIKVMDGLGKINSCCDAIEILQICLPKKLAEAVKQIGCRCGKAAL